jgi:putative membrane protein (TIGR04086 family)
VEEKYQGQFSTSYLVDLLKTVVLSLVVTFVILLLAALLLCFTDFPEQYTLPSAIAATIVGVFAGSSMAARKYPEKSLVSSLISAFVYAVIAYIVGCLMQGKFVFTLNTALFLAIALITGAIASILANRKKSAPKYGSGTSNLADKLRKKKTTKSYSFNRTGR